MQSYKIYRTIINGQPPQPIPSPSPTAVEILPSVQWSLRKRVLSFLKPLKGGNQRQILSVGIQITSAASPSTLTTTKMYNFCLYHCQFTSSTINASDPTPELAVKLTPSVNQRSQRHLMTCLHS